MKKIISIVSIALVVGCGKTGPNERLEDLSEQRYAQTGSLASLAGHSEGLVIELKGMEFTPSFSTTKRQISLYQNTLKALQGVPYSVDPSGKTVFTDWFINDQKQPMKITVLIETNDAIVNVFTKRNGQIVKDDKQTQTLTLKIKEN